MAGHKDRYVRKQAADALGVAFSQLPDKTLAWQDLVRLTQDEDIFVREELQVSEKRGTFHRSRLHMMQFSRVIQGIDLLATNLKNIVVLVFIYGVGCYLYSFFNYLVTNTLLLSEGAIYSGTRKIYCYKN